MPSSPKRTIIPRLREMCSKQPPGHSYTTQEIAERCQCSERNIQQIEQQALVKVRRKLKPLLEEMT